AQSGTAFEACFGPFQELFNCCSVGVDVPDDLEPELALDGHSERSRDESRWNVTGERAGAEQPAVAGGDLGDDGGHRAEWCGTAGRCNSGFGEMVADECVELWAFFL